MGLDTGTELGNFRIIGLLGRGGMGEVYRATDSKLGREVAIKVLPHVFALDAERLARFEREARVLATLDHPNIGALYDFQEDKGHHFLVMQLIEGETLADRIDKGAIPLEEALPLFAQIAEALEAAHAGGIVHRDLKPANIKIDENGNIKVLDFGLAMNLDGEVITIASPTDETKPGDTPPSKITMDGAIIGTPAYMSPEQARGKNVDKRADIWAFGACLYEALTGKMPFDEDTITDILASVLKQDVDFDKLPEDTPAKIRDLIESCLEKDVQYRLRDIGDAWSILRRHVTESGSIKAVPDPEAASPKNPYVLAVSVVFGALIIGAALLFGLRYDSTPAESMNEAAAPPPAPEPEPKPVRRFSITLPAEYPLSDGIAGLIPLALSPDGLVMVYVSDVENDSVLVMRPMDQLNGEPIRGTEGATQPFFSPEGEWIAFFADKKLRKVSIRGGAVVPLCDVPDTPWGGSWGDDGFIVFSSGKQMDLTSLPRLRRVSSSGGTVEEISVSESESPEGHVVPIVLPEGKGVVYSRFIVLLENPTELKTDVMLLPSDGSAPRLLIEGRLGLGYFSSGHLAYTVFQTSALSDNTMLVKFDLDTLEVGAMPFPIPPDAKGFTLTRGLMFAVSTQGTLVSLPAPPESGGNLQ